MDWDKIIKDAEFEQSQHLMRAEALADVIKSAKRLQGLGEIARATPSRKYQKTSRGRINPTREAVAKILEENGGPLQTRDLLPRLRARGVEVGGKDPVATLSARLSNSDDFRIDRAVGWWFSNKPIPIPMPSQVTMNEAEDRSLEVQPSASDTDQEGGDNRASLI